MLYESFCLGLQKIANPNILKYLDTYRPDAAKSAIHREFGLLFAALEKEGLDEEVKNSIRRRIDDLNRADYLVESYKNSLKEKGTRRSPSAHLVKGLNTSMASITAKNRLELSKKVLSGEITKQQSEIALKKQIRDSIPEGINRKYVEEFGANIGAVPSKKHIEKTLDDAILSNSVRPEYHEAKEELLNLLNPKRDVGSEEPEEEKNEGTEDAEEKTAAIKIEAPKMAPVPGTSRRGGLLASKKRLSVKSSSKPIVTKKLSQSLVSKENKAIGSKQSLGMSRPERLGSLDKVKAAAAAAKPVKQLIGLEALTSKKAVNKASKPLGIGGKGGLKSKFSFKTPKLAPSPNTKVTDYLKVRGLT